MADSYDVVIIGGGAAGLSAAVALLRSRRSVLVVDAGDPRNAPAGHVHNFLTRDGTAPGELYGYGRAEVEGYGGTVRAGRVDAVGGEADAFRVDVGGRTVTARRLLFATGARDELPPIPGLAPRWGRDVVHCPYCHGWEVRDQRIGVLVTGPASVHQVLLFRQLSPFVTVLAHTGPALSREQRDQFRALDVPVVEGEVVGVDTQDDALTGVRLAGGGEVPLDALAVAPFCRARAELLAPLGIEPSPFRMGDAVLGTYVEANPMGATAVAGVWVAGNVAAVQAQVISSAAAGLAAGAGINGDLAMADAGAAVFALTTLISDPSQ